LGFAEAADWPIGVLRQVTTPELRKTVGLSGPSRKRKAGRVLRIPNATKRYTRRTQGKKLNRQLRQGSVVGKIGGGAGIETRERSIRIIGAETKRRSALRSKVLLNQGGEEGKYAREEFGHQCAKKERAAGACRGGIANFPTKKDERWNDARSPET